MKIKEEKTMTISDFFQLANEEGGIYEIETPQGWIEIGCLVKKANKECFTIRTRKGKSLSGSSDHYIKTDKGWQKLEEINVQNCFVYTKHGKEEIVSLESIGIHDTFDLEVLNDKHKYYTNDIISHNTGKTTVGYIVCNNIPDHTVIWITPEIITENSGRVFNSIKILYKLADFVSPCVLILEDLDLFAQDRDSAHGTMDVRLGALMNILDGVNTIKNAITIATTNRLHAIEKALRNRPGRFDRIIEIPPLTSSLRTKMFKNRLKDWKVSNETIKYIVDNTDEWTGAEAQEFVNTLTLNFIRSNKKVKKVDNVFVDKVLKTMKQFGIGEQSGKLGFGKK